MAKITKIIGRQVFDSRGNPTIEAEVFSKNISGGLKKCLKKLENA